MEEISKKARYFDSIINQIYIPWNHLNELDTLEHKENQYGISLFETFKRFNDNDETWVKKIIYCLIDIKLQLAYIHKHDLPISGQIIRGSGKDGSVNESLIPENNLDYFICGIASNQTSIMRYRILFEKYLNFVYLFVAKKDYNKKKNKSKTNDIFNLLETDIFNNWNPILVLKDYIKDYDSSYRTPETHKYSSQRKYFSTSECYTKDCFCPDTCITKKCMVFDYDFNNSNRILQLYNCFPGLLISLLNENIRNTINEEKILRYKEILEHNKQVFSLFRN